MIGTLTDIRPAGQGARHRRHGNTGRGHGRPREMNIHSRNELTSIVVDRHVWSRDTHSKHNATAEVFHRYQFMCIAVQLIRDDAELS